jgi:hypothetical protein
MTLNPTPPRGHVEWSQLADVLVEVRLNGSAVRKGAVDDAVPDSSALWIKCRQ